MEWGCLVEKQIIGSVLELIIDSAEATLHAGCIAYPEDDPCEKIHELSLFSHMSTYKPSMPAILKLRQNNNAREVLLAMQ